jgi:hypothetical protein
MALGRGRSVVWIESGPVLALVEFAYDARIVAVVRQIPGRHYVPSAKVWTIPVRHATKAADLLVEAGCRVRLDGEVYVPHRRASGATATATTTTNPFTAMFAALPDELRRSAFRSLALVVHPDQGGTDTLMRLLIEAAGDAAKRPRLSA